MRICLFQMLDRGSLDENVERACEVIGNSTSDFLCLPEFFAIPGGYLRKFSAHELSDICSRVIDEVLKASKRFDGYVIAGSVVEDCYNTCHIVRSGEIVATYRKINPTEEEREIGIRPGKDVTILKTEFGRIGILICADCLNWDTVTRVASKSDIVFLPISLGDPRHPPVEGHPVSKRIAESFDVVVAKVSRIGVWNGKKFGVRSVVLSRDGVLAEAEKIDEELIFAEL